MLVKKINYTDYDGNERSEEFYFNLNESEVIKFLITPGDYTLDKLVERLTKERNGQKTMEIFEELIHRSYGVKSLDGRKFVKNDQVWEDFYQTEAYNQLFKELVTDAKKAAAFVNGIIPKKMSSDISKIIAENPDSIPVEVKEYLVGPVSGS